MTEKEHNMTWGEFKRAVDAAGIKDDEEIWYIRMWWPRPRSFQHEALSRTISRWDGRVAIDNE